MITKDKKSPRKIILIMNYELWMMNVAPPRRDWKNVEFFRHCGRPRPVGCARQSVGSSAKLKLISHYEHRQRRGEAIYQIFSERFLSARRDRFLRPNMSGNSEWRLFLFRDGAVDCFTRLIIITSWSSEIIFYTKHKNNQFYRIYLSLHIRHKILRLLNIDFFLYFGDMLKQYRIKWDI